MQKHAPQFSVGSLYICSKCGQTFDRPDNAEKLKNNLRAELKMIEAQKKIRVMVGSCISVCEDQRQAFAYYPNSGNIEIYSTTSDASESQSEILDFIKSRLPNKF